MVRRPARSAAWASDVSLDNPGRARSATPIFHLDARCCTCGAVLTQRISCPGNVARRSRLVSAGLAADLSPAGGRQVAIGENLEQRPAYRIWPRNAAPPAPQRHYAPPASPFAMGMHPGARKDMSSGPGNFTRSSDDQWSLLPRQCMDVGGHSPQEMPKPC
jgi:hypothetical protein